MTRRLCFALQLADLATTLWIFRLGGFELNPLARLAPALGPVAGVLAAKMLAIALICVLRNRRALALCAAAMSCVVAWNLVMIGVAL